jgi:polyribonucleotide nucleotidyltransferase
VRDAAAGQIRETIQNPDKAARESAISELNKEIVERLLEKYPERESDLREAVDKVVKQEVRSLILNERRRPDGRALDEIRPISCEVGLLPRAHGSALFKRGQTQVLTVTTLGASDEEQRLDSLGEEETKRYMHHYNFPPFSVGEVRPLRGAGRREIGHVALAERALREMLPEEEEFPYVVRLVSEVLESNGSTSMASVCGSTLSLMDAGVKIQAPVAGVAMGLMTEGERFAVLTDIQGMEDFGGDMDFKVAGTREGITAIQMDTKISGIPTEVLTQALEQARQGRLFILEKMLEAIAEPRENLSPYAPRIFIIEIHPDKIGDVIGPGGKIIKKIQAETGAKIDIEQSGKVYVASVDAGGGERAVKMIEDITRDVKVGEVYLGRVTRMLNFGAFVEVLPGREGLVHVSQLAAHRVERPEDVVKIGDELMVKVAEIDSQGRINLTRKGLLPEGEPDIPDTPEGAGPPRGGGGYGGGGGGRGGRPPRDGGRPPRRPEPREPSPSGEGSVGARFRPPRRKP